jgi:transposase
MTPSPLATRWAIIHEWRKDHNIARAAKSAGVSIKACKQWVQRYQRTGDVQEMRRSGRRRVLSSVAEGIALDLLLSNQAGGAKAVAAHLHAKGLTTTMVSKHTIIRAARRVASNRGIGRLKALKGKPQKQLSAATLQKRLAFCRQHKRTNWNNVMFTDRKKFAFCYPGSKVYPVTWVAGSGRRQANAVNHASVVNVYAGLTRFGMTKLHVVAGTTGHKSAFVNMQGQQSRNITRNEYKVVLEQTLLPEGRRLFGTQGISTWILQQDNDPAHKLAPEIVRQYNQRYGCSVSVLPNWPPSSPDLSLIENVWSILQSRLDSHGCKTFADFKAALVKEAKSISGSLAQGMFDGMAARVQDCIKKGGDRTRH